jgi:hypothetical protein
MNCFMPHSIRGFESVFRKVLTSATPKKVEIHVREEKHLANELAIIVLLLHVFTHSLFASNFKLTD